MGMSYGSRRRGFDQRILEHLVEVTAPYGISPNSLREGLQEANAKGKSRKGRILIERRTGDSTRGVFRFTREGKLLAQTQINLLLIPRISSKAGFIREREGNHINATPNRSAAVRVNDLKVGMKKVQVKGKVVDKTLMKQVVSRFDFSPLNVATATLSDDTGSIKLTLWNDQINSVSVGDEVKVENAYVRSFRGEKLLGISRNGTIRKL